MEINEFSNELKHLAINLGIDLTDEEVNAYFDYMNVLIEWNNNINLTAITEPKEVILKHFIDSLTISKYIENNKKVIDIGTGAGFPGLPLGILRKDLNILLMDSLNKRIKFLDEVCSIIDAKNIDTIHARAEELANNNNYREMFDYATSRAVAPLNTLLEYMLPFIKVGGYCICMKGSNISPEIESSTKALKVLGGEIIKVEEFNLPESDIGRNIVIIKKINHTPSKYPRKAGTPSKDPIQ